MKKIYKCTECGETFTFDDCELLEPRTINDDTEHERIVCDTCFDNIWDNNDLTHCDNCGVWFENKLIHEETVGGYGFAPCPNCGRDVIDGETKTERLEEAKLTEAEENPSFAVTMTYEDGDNATYLFPTTEQRSAFIDQQLKDYKEDGVYLGSARIHNGQLVVVTEDDDKKKHRILIVESNVYR